MKTIPEYDYSDYFNIHDYEVDYKMITHDYEVDYKMITHDYEVDYKMITHDYEVDYKRPTPEDRITEILILSIVIILSLIGNILVVVISGFCMRLRSLTSIFILNLALSDLLFTVGLVFKVYNHFWGLSLGDSAFEMVNCIFSAGYYSSIAFLVLMSVQRYMAVVHPLSGWKKGCWVTCILICAWVMSILAALPAMVHFLALSSRGCTYSSPTAIMCEHIIVFVCAFLVMAICYIRILQTIFKSPTNQSHRTTAFSFLLVATFFIFWAPYNIVNFLLILNIEQILNNNFTLVYAICICHLLAFSRCCLNPVIYGLLSIKFRKERRATSDSEQIGMEDCHLTSETV